MPTTNDLLQATKRWLHASGRPEYNRLVDALTSSSGTATFEFPMGSIAPGAVIGSNLEEMYVWSVTGQVATIGRGLNGSTAQAHSAGTMVSVNPMFSNWRVLNEVNSEINSLSSPANGLYRIKTATITTTVASSYDLAADALAVLAVQYNAWGSSSDWPLLRRWDLLTDQDSSLFASGTALRLFEMPSPGHTLRVVYAAALSPLTGIFDDVATVTGLPASATDIPAIGAAARLLSARESRRSQVDMQPEPRQAQDVPPGAARSAAAGLFALRDRRVKEEAAKLARQYPSTMKRAAV